MSKKRKPQAKKKNAFKQLAIGAAIVLGALLSVGVVTGLTSANEEDSTTPKVHTHTYVDYVCSTCGAESPFWTVEDADGSAVYLLTDSETSKLKAGTVVDFFDESWGYLDKLKGSVIESVETEGEYTVLYFGAVEGTSQTDIADHVVAGGYCRIAG